MSIGHYEQCGICHAAVCQHTLAKELPVDPDNEAIVDRLKAAAEAKCKVPPMPKSKSKFHLYRSSVGACHSNDDGDCAWSECPQLRDGEPLRSGRHCPIDDTFRKKCDAEE